MRLKDIKIGSVVFYNDRPYKVLYISTDTTERIRILVENIKYGWKADRSFFTNKELKSKIVLEIIKKGTMCWWFDSRYLTARAQTPIAINDNNFPLPTFKKVKECYLHDVDGEHDSIAIIGYDCWGGNPNRYHVIRVMVQTGITTCLARECPLKDCRKIAKRQASEDGKPL